MMSEPHAAAKKNLDVKASTFIASSNLLVEEKYAIVTPNDDKEVQINRNIVVYLLPRL